VKNPGSGVLAGRGVWVRLLESAQLLGNVAADGFSTAKELEEVKARLVEEEDVTPLIAEVETRVSERFTTIIEIKDETIEELTEENELMKNNGYWLYKALEDLVPRHP